MYDIEVEITTDSSDDDTKTEEFFLLPMNHVVNHVGNPKKSLVKSIVLWYWEFVLESSGFKMFNSGSNK